MRTVELIDDLSAVLREQMARARAVKALPSEALLHRPAPEQWNALEILEHLNLSSGIYVRGLEKVFAERAAALPFHPAFRPGVLGGLFTRSMAPRPDGSIPNRMRTFRRMDPPKVGGASLESIDRFIDHCTRMLALLERARSTDLDRMKVASSLGPVIRFKAGDAFRFPVGHQQRHFLQLERVLAAAADQRTTTSRWAPCAVRTV